MIMKERAPDGTLPPSPSFPRSPLNTTGHPPPLASEDGASPATAIGFRPNPSQAATTEDLFEEDVMWGNGEPASRDLAVVVREMTTNGAPESARSPPLSIPARKIRKSGAFRGGDSEESDEEEMVPPHIIIEKRFAGDGRKTASSVVTGNGRTLKGRDLRRVRNSVLMQTGFLEGRLLPSELSL
ncbi:uncharacterized protein LOC116266285 [Nymphaea colorata]|uniref:Uncharacterized protein n=1 Tax=Nymphaea colorata TaxID=210225 RepID=A0A5K0W912_9MAGN|nr:uncharacterized protein LOC116266285 [Nymphaea colorata]